MVSKIGLISDTHGLLRPEVLKELSSCDFIIHGGDVDNPEVLETLEFLAPVYAVRGNNDWDWGRDIPETLRFQIGGVNFFVVHNKRDVPENLDDVHVVVFGHSHRYFEQNIDGRLWLNPGSCGKRRFGLEASMAVLFIEDGSVRVEKILIEPDRERALYQEK